MKTITDAAYAYFTELVLKEHGAVTSHLSTVDTSKRKIQVHPDIGGGEPKPTRAYKLNTITAADVSRILTEKGPLSAMEIAVALESTAINIAAILKANEATLFHHNGHKYRGSAWGLTPFNNILEPTNSTI